MTDERRKTKDASDAATEYAFRYHKSQERLALALSAIEAAKETIALLVASYAATTSGMGVGDGVLNRIDRYQAEFAELVTKLEAAK